jgi:hypothetical protein
LIRHQQQQGVAWFHREERIPLVISWKLKFPALWLLQRQQQPWRMSWNTYTFPCIVILSMVCKVLVLGCPAYMSFAILWLGVILPDSVGILGSAAASFGARAAHQERKVGHQERLPVEFGRIVTFTSSVTSWQKCRRMFLNTISVIA